MIPDFSFVLRWRQIAPLLIALTLSLSLLSNPMIGVHPTDAATNWIVTTLSDGAGTCPDPSSCTLRQAITNALADSGDAITFTVSGTITLASTLPTITTPLTIDGSGQTVTISGNNAVEVFTIGSSGNLTLNSLTIANGDGNVRGGGLSNGGILTIRNST